MTLPLPQGEYFFRDQPFPVPSGLGWCFQLEREQFQVQGALLPDKGFEWHSIKPTKAESESWMRAWLLAWHKMARGIWSPRMLVFDAREVEHFLRIDRTQPLWSSKADWEQIQAFDLELRSIWVELTIQSTSLEGLSSPLDQRYISKLRWLKLYCEKVSQAFENELDMSLVALEDEAIVVELKAEARLLEVTPIVKLLSLMEQNVQCRSPSLTLKWVAEP